MQKKKLPLKELFKKMEPRQAEVAQAIFDDYREVITTIPGALSKHQVWEGGYISHVEEAMNLAVVLYEAMSDCRPLDFSLSDTLFCVYMHDFDKVQRYRKQPDGSFAATGEYNGDYVERTAAILKESYDYELTPEQFNALKYAHGEGDDYHPTERIMLPLATLVHCCDVISARVWYDDGRDSNNW